MFKKISALQGVKLLSKDEQQAINGGVLNVECNYSDGLGYDLTYNSTSAAIDAILHCIESGGDYTLIIYHHPDLD
ncbi:hypothetical protein [Dokdonia sp.]|uniref:hypothetical protein n=1 Tax=Dokdonia sp. TaxID=2024995 RepID=UPI0032637288